MNLDYEAIEHLKLALSRLSKAKRLLQNELMKVESCNNNRLSRSVIEESYVAAIDTLNSISFALEDIKSVGQNDLSDVSFDKTLFDFEPSYDENFGFQDYQTLKHRVEFQDWQSVLSSKLEKKSLQLSLGDIKKWTILMSFLYRIF